ncbi:uncharacterized protein QC761_111690 [Podospora bellae-mahoneyi]|uniref:Uncharacterized protein n=1 Tax=Podospora bellae-mahoneyi TaxID=2093777 RepID=A0ABR0FXD6_9PEZI|nr:hypothetical protein QC761_111690 [Podospora bellae-mahoneyi]
MASATTPTASPPKPPRHESPAKRAESPLPSPSLHSEQAESDILPHSPLKSVANRRMADTQSSIPKPPGTTRVAQVKTPEPRILKERPNGNIAERSPSTPGHLAPFDWEEFEARYQEALAKANGEEQELLAEFENLIKERLLFFNVWASSASVHDTERGVKRLQTRERYVKIAEQNLAQKKKHLTEVVRAFQSALALLSQN